MNNSLQDAYGIDSYKFFVLNDNPIPFAPSEFAITSKDQVTLIASTGNGFIGTSSYDIEIDTTELFNSALKQTAVVQAQGGMVKWQPNINYQDEQVYYWRVRSADPEFGISFWNNSSFIHMDNVNSGWNQSDMFQYLKDESEYIEIDSVTRDFEYGLANYEFKITNFVRAANEFPELRINQTLAAASYGDEIGGGIYVVVADPNTLIPIQCPVGGIHGADYPVNPIATDQKPRNVFPFRTDNVDERAELANFLTNPTIIPDGYYIWIWTIQADWGANYNVHLWEDEMFEIFENEGATSILRDQVNDPKPYVFVYQKGVGPLGEVVASTIDDEAVSVTNIEEKWFEGTISTDRIGPAKTWEKFQWDISDYQPSTDQFDLRLIGINPEGDEDTLAKNIVNKDYDLSTINASQYPYLKLEMYTKDSLLHTALDIDYWRVIYRDLPEAVLSTVNNFEFHADTLERGEIMSIEYDIENVSMSNMDSMLVRYSIVDFENNEISSEDRKAPLQMLSSYPDKFEYDTQNLNGLYQLRVEINPEKDQPEQFSFNNRGIVNFLVRADDINPLLDVTFDGIRILDGDIVSPLPMIKIALTDENKNQLIENPENFFLTLEYEDGTVEEIDVNGPDVNFIPSSEENGYTACLEYTPSLASGEYTLFAQGLDATGNFSGDHAISNVLNYPNPFSNSTQFVFTLTGDQMPQDYHIKIMTLSGKIVREITAADIGPLRVGVNRTDYKWDGTDEFGSKLANGVYLYKFYTDIKEELDEFKLDDVDQYFKEGFGKLVIMR